MECVGGYDRLTPVRVRYKRKPLQNTLQYNSTIVTVPPPTVTVSHQLLVFGILTIAVILVLNPI